MVKFRLRSVADCGAAETATSIGKLSYRYSAMSLTISLTVDQVEQRLGSPWASRADFTPEER